ncbi:MAG: hypothetical protein U0625_01750 [Phycisphaerales bacterium]
MESAEFQHTPPPARREPRRDARHGARISPVAVGLTLAAVAFAVMLGVKGPRLRERHGSTQQDLPVGELATMAALHEAQAAYDILNGRSREAALDRMDQLAAETIGHATAPDFTSIGYDADDARIVEIAPSVHALMVLYRNREDDEILTVAMLPDDGRVVRYDGFGRALPFPPGDEWFEVLADEQGGSRRAAFATSDGRIFWLLLGNGPQALSKAAAKLRR